MRSPIHISASGRQLAWLAILLAMVCLIGDSFVAASQGMRLYEAVLDNLTHATISAVATGIVVTEFANRLTIAEQRILVACGFFVAASVDVDHFVEAHSWYLFDATHLNRRPFLHCSNIPFIVLIVFILCANLRTFRLNIWLAMVLTALTSHHIRDATRRGFWIRPYGDTPPLPYVVYVALTVALPFAVIGLVNVFHTKWSTVKEQYRERLLDV